MDHFDRDKILTDAQGLAAPALVQNVATGDDERHFPFTR